MLVHAMVISNQYDKPFVAHTGIYQKMSMEHRYGHGDQDTRDTKPSIATGLATCDGASHRASI
jgi:hypothetical protein